MKAFPSHSPRALTAEMLGEVSELLRGPRPHSCPQGQAQGRCQPEPELESRRENLLRFSVSPGEHPRGFDSQSGLGRGVLP